MQKFTRLYMDLDESNRTNDKLEFLRRYFQEAPPEDAAWAIHFLMGNRVPRGVNSPLLRQWLAEVTTIPDWLVEESYHMVGDLAETIALLLPGDPPPLNMPLSVLVNEHLIPLKQQPEEARRETVLSLWRQMDRDQRFVWNKLITGSFRVGVSKTLVIKALAQIHEVEQATMAHRLMGTWLPTPESVTSLADPIAHETNPARPYPFFLANPLPSDFHEKELVEGFQAEWKWDGIRSQLIRRQDQAIIWSRGEELITHRFPELEEAARAIPNGTVLDGEILAWKDDKPGSFQDLQTRINRKTISKKMIADVPVVFMAYDIMEWDSTDLRNAPLQQRREKLEQLIHKLPDNPLIKISPLISASSWQELTSTRTQSRQRKTEGLMLKRLNSAYQSGRARGDWWKWKVDPYTLDAVLTYAQPGHGRRAGLFTDYTFGVWRGSELITIAKAYSGLTDTEINEVDSWIRKNTTEKFGPVRMVKPILVFELAFEGIQFSTRHKSGFAVRFPRIQRWRKDKAASEADTVETLQDLLGQHQQ